MKCKLAVAWILASAVLVRCALNPQPFPPQQEAPPTFGGSGDGSSAQVPATAKDSSTGPGVRGADAAADATSPDAGASATPDAAAPTDGATTDSAAVFEDASTDAGVQDAPAEAIAEDAPAEASLADAGSEADAAGVIDGSAESSERDADAGDD